MRTSCEHRRARRPPASSNPFGASPPFRRGCHPPPERRESPDQDERAVGEQRLNEPKPVAPRPMRAEHDRVADRRGAFLATTDPRSGLRPRTGGGTPRAIARIEVRAIGSAMWLVRCCCRRGPLRIPAPALVESRPSRSREPVSGGSCHLRSGVLARPNRARGTNVAVGRVARLRYGVTTRNGRLALYKYVYKT